MPGAAAHAAALAAAAEMWRATQTDLDRLLTTRIAGFKFKLAVSLFTVVMALALAALLARWIANSISRPLANIQTQMARLAVEGDTSIVIPYRQRRDEVGRMAGALETFRQTALRAIRDQTALESVGTPVMVADTCGTLLGVNRAATEHFREVGPQLGLAGFHAEALPGSSLSRLIPDAEDIITGLRDTLRRRLRLGSRTFDVAMNPVVDRHGQRLGAVIEWQDLTQQLKIEDEVGALVEAAVAGDFSSRLDPAGQTGFMKKLSQGINALVGTVQENLEEVVTVTAALAEGDLRRRIAKDFRGAFSRLKNDSNTMSERLTGVVGGIGGAATLVNEAATEISHGGA
ncbi:MAG: HAMP domain-containing protein, partial [Rhodospirillales bacterium]|nr:HAMP domain-containing protein [Rhodospirillales bacterium]